MSFEGDVLVASDLFGLRERNVLLLWDHTQQASGRLSGCSSGLFVKLSWWFPSFDRQDKEGNHDVRCPTASSRKWKEPVVGGAVDLAQLFLTNVVGSWPRRCPNRCGVF